MSTPSISQLRRDPLIDGLCHYADATRQPVDAYALAECKQTLAVVRRSNRVLYAPLLMVIPCALGPVAGILDAQQENAAFALAIVGMLAFAMMVIHELQAECTRLAQRALERCRKVDPAIEQRVAHVRRLAANRIDILAVIDHAQANRAITVDLLDIIEQVVADNRGRHHA